MFRSHNCNQLNKDNKGQRVTLAGWVDRRRDHGGLIFIDLRDREGLVQVIFNPEKSKQCHDIASRLRNEYVISTSGEVGLRPPGTENKKMASKGPRRPKCPIIGPKHMNVPNYNYKKEMADYMQRFGFKMEDFYVHSSGLLEALANAFER